MTAEAGAIAKEVTLMPLALAEIREHAAATYPDECCGALLAREGAIVEAHRLENTTPESAARRFLIEPGEYRRAEARARSQALTLVGFYHSHPDAFAQPSGHDLEQAWPNLTYIIVAVNHGTPGDISAWRLRDDRSGFDRGELTCPTGF